MIVLLFPASPVWGYRLFVSTDTAVADPQAMEIELGYVDLKRAEKKTLITTPHVVLNYGLARNWEVIGEFAVEKSPDDSAHLGDLVLSLKAILKEGILQNKDGIGFAVELGPLFPSPTPDERRFGVEGIGIVSGRVSSLTYHVNVGGGVERAKTHPFAIWGMIVEFPLLPHFRLVGEVNGESVNGELADHSGPLGFLWQPPSSAVLIDVGIRKGLSRRASEWQFTTSLTWSFSLLCATSVGTSGGRP